MPRVLVAGLLAICTLGAQPAPGASSVEGRILDSLTGAPVRKATVELTTAGGRIWLLAQTDAEGRFQFTALPPESYRLAAKRSGFLDRAVRRPVGVGQDEHVTGVEIRLKPLSSIAGRVLDEDGDGVGGAPVSLFRQVYGDGGKRWGRVNAAVVADDTGEYRCSALKPGRYLVQARHPRPIVDSQYGARDLPDRPLMTYVPAYYPNALTEQEASAVELGIGAEVHGVDVHLSKSPLFHVRGTVSGVSLRSGTFVRVGLSPVDRTVGGGGGGGEAGLPPDCAFDIRVTAGRYTISATQGYADAPEAYASDSVTVSGNVTGLVLAMGPPMSITGRISVAESGSRANLQHVRVNLNSLGSGYGGPDERPDATGRLVFPQPTPPGHYALSVYASSLPEGFYVKTVRLGGHEVSPEDIEIRASAEIEIILSNKAGTITGLASDGDGKPIPNSRATLIPLDSNALPSAQFADDAGKFKFTALRPGKYKLFAWEEVEDGVWQDPEFSGKYESQAKEVTIGPSETRDVQLRAVTEEEMN